jgi:hypothetical protein
MRTVRTFVLLITTFFSAVGTCFGENAVILEQKGAPLKIVEYTSEYAPDLSSRYGSSPEQIRHKVVVENISGKTVVAYQIGLVAFDAFNGFMGKFNGWAVESILTSAKKDGVWSQRPYAVFSFQKYGTGVSYVNAARFEDGSIWRVNSGEVLLELQRFEKSLTKEDLLDKKGP